MEEGQFIVLMEIVENIMNLENDQNDLLKVLWPYQPRVDKNKTDLLSPCNVHVTNTQQTTCFW